MWSSRELHSQKWKQEVLNIGVDPAHEQNNKVIKIDGETIGIFDNPKALLRWAMAGPIVAQICEDAQEEEAKEKNTMKTIFI